MSGMGFGVIAGVVAFANTLKLSGGPAVVGVDGGGSQFFVLASGERGREGGREGGGRGGEIDG